MTAKTRGHTLAHRWLYVTLVDVAAFIATALIWDATGRPGPLIVIGAVLVLVGIAAAFFTGVLYAGMFAAWVKRERAAREDY